MKLISGQKLASKINDSNVEEILKLNNLDKNNPNVSNLKTRPSLAIILIGTRTDSELYVNLKEKKAVEIGIDTHTYRFNGQESEAEIIKVIEFLNNDDNIDGILVQVPLPSQYNTDKIIQAIKPSKDVDCFHPQNYPQADNCPKIISPVYASVLEVIKAAKVKIENKKAVVLANSEIFGNGLKAILECHKIKTEVAYLKNKDWSKKSQTADILISAIGQKHFIKKEHVKKDCLLIDVGISKEENKVYGDIDLKDVKEKALAATPVPGGIGPMTIAMLFKNVIELHKKRVD
jgi:methylenetetrahydrofolate dehydrogenase (NADP+)/methenyltetrahydrofolate cyclohydrolase